MGFIYTYKDMVREMSLFDKEIMKFNNLKKITDSKVLLKKLNKKLQYVKKMLVNLPFEEINFHLTEKTNNRKIYIIFWDIKIDASLSRIKYFLRRMKDEDVEIKLKLETQNLIIDNLEVQIETDNFNSIHFPVELPDFYKNIGLGLKIFLKATNEFGHISSLIASSQQASFEAKMVFEHLLRNDEVYTITKNNSGLLFISKNVNFTDIEKLVKEYLDGVDKQDYAIDKFLKGKINI